MNGTDERAKKLNLIYHEYPQYSVWNNQTRKWSYRKWGIAIGRIVYANPLEHEHYFVRMLLLSRHCLGLFGYLKRTIDVEHATFCKGALALGLLDLDDYLETTHVEATTNQMHLSLRRIFATILAYCFTSNPRALWDKFKYHLTEDLANHTEPLENLEAHALQQINAFRMGLGRSLREYNITSDYNSVPLLDSSISEMQYEHNITVLDQYLTTIEQLNNG